MEHSKLIIDSDEEELCNKKMDLFIKYMNRDEKVALKNLLRIKEREEKKITLMTEKC